MATALNNATQATVEQVSSGVVTLLGWMANGNNVPQGVQVPLETFAAALGALLPVVATGSVTSVSTTPTALPLPTLPVMANTQGVQTITGTVIAQNVSTGNSSVWDVAISVERTATGASLSPVGGSLINATVRQQDTSMAACTVTASIGTNGPSVMVTGLSGATINWAATFTVVTTG
jgi:hypothetical protein